MTQLPPTVTQNADVRFLGKLLGDVIRTHGGESLFQRIEAIRAARSTDTAASRTRAS